MNAFNLESTLRKFLSAYWLRPETALFRTIDCHTMANFTIAGPSLDLGCGDGVFSFLRGGGEMSFEFDVFKHVSQTREFFQNIDVYNTFDDNVAAQEIVCPPTYTFDVGIDHKNNLLRRAASLGMYKRLFVHDANEKMPFTDQQFSTIFTNILYWLDDLPVVLAELYRILNADGHIAVMVPDKSFYTSSFVSRQFSSGSSKKWIRMLERGVFSDNVKHAYTFSEWKDIFERAGFHIAQHNIHLSTMLLNIWSVGFRPMFPVFNRMVRAVPAGELLPLKQEWVDLLYEFALPFCEEEIDRCRNMDGCFHFFILRR